MAAARLDIKRGDTYVVTVTATEDDGTTPIDLTGWTIRSQIRDAEDVLVAQLRVTVTNAAAGQFTLDQATPDTTGWPVGTCSQDIEYTDPSGRVISTGTFSVRVAKDITT